MYALYKVFVLNLKYNYNYNAKLTRKKSDDSNGFNQNLSKASKTQKLASHTKNLMIIALTDPDKIKIKIVTVIITRRELTFDGIIIKNSKTR